MITVLKYNKEEKLEILESCKDYYKLSNSLEYEFLEKVEKKLQHYYNYLLKNNNIDDYKREFGNYDVVNWFEGLISTKDFIEQNKNNNLFNFRDTKECIKILKKFEKDLNKLNLNAEEKFNYIIQEYGGLIEFQNQDTDKYTIELYQNYNEGCVLATFNIDIKTGISKLLESFDIFNNQNNLFLEDYSIEDINNNIEKEITYEI